PVSMGSRCEGSSRTRRARRSWVPARRVARGGRGLGTHAGAAGDRGRCDRRGPAPRRRDRAVAPYVARGDRRRVAAGPRRPAGWDAFHHGRCVGGGAVKRAAVLAVDGGGSKVDAVLIRRDGTVLGAARI